MDIGTNNLQFFDVDYDNIPVETLSADVQSMLQLVNRKVATKDSLDEVMNYVFEAARKMCPCERMGLAFVEEEGRRVTSRWCRASYQPVLLGNGYTEDMAESSLLQVIEQRKVRVINDLSLYLRQFPNSCSSDLLLQEGVRSSMTCPLQVEGRTVALLFLSSRSPRAFSEQHVIQHLAIAERLAQTVDYTCKLDQCAETNTNYSEMLGFVSHELKSPLSSIIMDSQLLSDEYLGELNDKQREKIQKVHAKADYLLNLVRDYLDLARIEGGMLKLNPRQDVDLDNDVISPALSMVEAQLFDKKMQLVRVKPEIPLKIEVDPVLLKIVFTNLLSNAIKYGRRLGEIRLRHGIEHGKLTVSVRNEGPGWPQSMEQNLFRKFSRLDTSELKKRSGTGVGLYTTWRIIKLHGGMIRAQSQHGQWAKFTFDIPQPLKPAEDPAG